MLGDISQHNFANVELYHVRLHWYCMVGAGFVTNIVCWNQGWSAKPAPTIRLDIIASFDFCLLESWQ